MALRDGPQPEKPDSVGDEHERTFDCIGEKLKKQLPTSSLFHPNPIVSRDTLVKSGGILAVDEVTLLRSAARLWSILINLVELCNIYFMYTPHITYILKLTYINRSRQNITV